MPYAIPNQMIGTPVVTGSNLQWWGDNWPNYGPPSAISQPFAGAVSAFMEYTFGGPIHLMASKSSAQAAFLTLTGLYGTFRTGLAIELGMDFAILGAVLTVIDPLDKWEGGLDEVLWEKNQPLPNTMSHEEPNPLIYGLKEGWRRSPANPDNW